MRELNADLPNFAGLEALARQLLRRESVASSRIEGLVMSHRRLAKAAVADEITVVGLVDVHRALMENTRDAHLAGQVRTRQSWIGGSDYSPRGAAFVPPPEDDVDRLLEDLAAFMNATTCRPRCRPRSPTPSSRRSTRLPTATAAPGAAWCTSCTGAACSPRASCPDLARHGHGGRRVRSRPDRVSGGAAVGLVRGLRADRDPSLPRGATAPPAHQAVNALEAAGVLEQITVGRRNRAWEAVGLLKLIDDFERRLAVPDPSDGKPARPAPYEH